MGSMIWLGTNLAIGTLAWTSPWGHDSAWDQYGLWRFGSALGNVIWLGDIGDKNLLKRMRAQANCAEYAPLALILLLLTELNGAPAIALHLLGLALVSGRILHAYGFASTPQKIILRQIGMGLTMGMMALSALGLLGHALL